MQGPTMARARSSLEFQGQGRTHSSGLTLGAGAGVGAPGCHHRGLGTFTCGRARQNLRPAVRRQSPRQDAALGQGHR